MFTIKKIERGIRMVAKAIRGQAVPLSRNSIAFESPKRRELNSKPGVKLTINKGKRNDDRRDKK